MFKPKEIEKHLVMCLAELESVKQVEDAANELISQRRAFLEQERQHLEALMIVSLQKEGVESQFAENIKAVQLKFADMALATGNKQRRRKRDKPDVQIIEEILREYGPLHVANIVELGQERGVPFIGREKPTRMAVAKMFYCKRFKQFGNNVWGLPNQELPEQPTKPSTNGHIPDAGLLATR